MALGDRHAELEYLGRRYLQAIVQGRRDDACELVMAAAAEGAPILDIYERVLGPAQRGLGRLWELERISVAQEHFGTATTQLVMSQLFGQFVGSTPRIGRSLVAACVEGDLHEIGLRMVADSFELAGWQTHYIGGNTPVDAIVEQLLQRRPDAFAVSAAMPEYLPLVRVLVAAVKSQPGLQMVRVVVGGRAFDADPEMAEWVRADFHGADPEEARVWLEDPEAALPPRSISPTPELEVASPRSHVQLDDLTRLNNELVSVQRRFTQERAALEQSADRARQYLGMAVHDLRGALGVVRGLTGHLAGELEEKLDDEQREMFEVVCRSTDYMSAVVRRALEVAQGGELELAVDRIEADLCPILSTCVQRARYQAEQRRVQVDLTIPEAPVMASVDVRRVEQIVDNLLGNAILASPFEGSCSIVLEDHECDVKIRVEDEGPGIRPDERAQVFKPFYVGPSKGSRGSGLGLAIVRRLAEAHGGRAEVGQSEMGGAAFVVTLDKSARSAPTASASQ